jgi:glucose/arabinose dehydrogenase
MMGWRWSGAFGPTAILGLVLNLCTPALAGDLSPGISTETDQADFEALRMAGPLEHPWSMAFVPDGGMLVTERTGRLVYVGDEGKLLQPVSGLPPIVAAEHAGLLDVVLDPDYAANRTIYLSYVHGTEELSTLRVLKASFDLNDHALSGQTVIFESAPPRTELINYGGRMAFDAEGHLFLTLGDRYDAMRGQDLSEDLGSIIRMNRDGSFPPDNPFASRPGVHPGIWSYGHRNPQGLAIDAHTGQVWAHEHGPQGGDELNLVLPGHNYGWAAITYGINYDGTEISPLTAAEGMDQPLYYWVPSVALSGLAIYQSDRVPQWRNTMWLGTLVEETLIRLTFAQGKVVREERLLHEKLGRIRDVRVGPDGLIYLLTDEPEGVLYRLEPRHRSAARNPCSNGASGSEGCRK